MFSRTVSPGSVSGVAARSFAAHHDGAGFTFEMLRKLLRAELFCSGHAINGTKTKAVNLRITDIGRYAMARGDNGPGAIRPRVEGRATRPRTRNGVSAKDLPERCQTDADR
jgi:hypothetical protein